MYVRDYIYYDIWAKFWHQLYLFRAFTEFTNTVVAMEIAKDILDILPWWNYGLLIGGFSMWCHRNMLMQIMTNLFQILIWPVRNLSP